MNARQPMLGVFVQRLPSGVYIAEPRTWTASSQSWGGATPVEAARRCAAAELSTEADRIGLVRESEEVFFAYVREEAKAWNGCARRTVELPIGAGWCVILCACVVFVWLAYRLAKGGA